MNGLGECVQQAILKEAGCRQSVRPVSFRHLSACKGLRDWTGEFCCERGKTRGALERRDSFPHTVTVRRGKLSPVGCAGGDPVPVSEAWHLHLRMCGQEEPAASLLRWARGSPWERPLWPGAVARRNGTVPQHFQNTLLQTAQSSACNVLSPFGRTAWYPSDVGGE